MSIASNGDGFRNGVSKDEFDGLTGKSLMVCQLRVISDDLSALFCMRVFFLDEGKSLPFGIMVYYVDKYVFDFLLFFFFFSFEY